MCLEGPVLIVPQRITHAEPLDQAASPDEAALVVAAKVFGFFFYKRTPNAVIVRESERGKVDVEREYTVLAVLEFNSNRKRQSVIVRESSGRIVLYIKVWPLRLRDRQSLSSSGRLNGMHEC